MGQIERKWLAILCCPSCNGELETYDASTEGLICRGCSAVYSVRDGVPQLVRNNQGMEQVAVTFGMQWTEHSSGTFGANIYGQSEDQEVTSFFQRLRLSNHIDPTMLKDKLILDAGCGSGRLSAALARLGANAVIGLDISDSVNVAVSRSKDLSNMLVVQGDFLSCPLRSESFDIVWSEGAIHATPTPQRALLKLASLVRPGGRLYVWVYPPRRSAYQWIRAAMPFAQRLPPRTRLRLSHVLSKPLSVVLNLRFALQGKPRRPAAEIALGLHDNLAPEHQSRHDTDEICGWLSDAGFEHVTPVGPPTGVLAVRGNTQSRPS